MQEQEQSTGHKSTMCSVRMVLSLRMRGNTKKTPSTRYRHKKQLQTGLLAMYKNKKLGTTNPKSERETPYTADKLHGGKRKYKYKNRYHRIKTNDGDIR